MSDKEHGYQKGQRQTLQDMELDILKFWEDHQIFAQSLQARKDGPLFSFYDGPPFATGLPHYGHLLAGTIKDVIPRYKAMKGFYVPRRFGWDCHGLPVENEIEKAKALGGVNSIEKFGIAQFNEECRGIVQRYTSEWKQTVERLGRWVDFDKTYKTMDLNYMESVWWVFSELHKKGLIYEGYKVMPFSAKLGTPISNFEANLNYRDVDDPSLIIAVPLKDQEEPTFLLIWTTTPWTLPSNMAVIVNEDFVYAKVKHFDSSKYYIVSKARVTAYFKEGEYEIVDTFKGSKLEYVNYEPLFDYFVDTASPGAFRVLCDDFVGEEEGTGIVHAAPAFGEADFFVCTRENIELVCPVDQNGKFTDEIPEYAGQFVKDTDKDVIKRLKAKGLVFDHKQIRHRYPFCWRSDTPLIYKVVSTYFVSVEKIKNLLIEANKEINWVPEHIKFGRFGKWLENARDWAISRNRYWGTPMPIWKNSDGEWLVIGSVEELKKKVGKKQKIEDIHRHYIDQLTIEHEGKIYTRITEVFDCWFESGSMPYAQNHYPFENEEMTMESFPGDFIGEGLDQTRGWFYTLNVLSVALFNKPAFKNVIVNGIILAEDGTKMSKRLNNYPDVGDVFKKYGADALRLYLMSSNATHGEDMRFSERGVELTMRQVLIPLWNSFLFFSTYRDIYRWSPGSVETSKDQMDQWIISKMHKLINDVETAMDKYQLSSAAEPLVTFIDQLTNWYIRRSRSRFWSEKNVKDRDQAFATLHTVLMTLCKVAAPFIPFLTESIFLKLRTNKDPKSVHLCDFPVYNHRVRHECLEKEMALIQNSVSMGHALRKEHKMKVRQPLEKAVVLSAKQEDLDLLERQKHLIKDELNVKNVELSSKEEDFVQLNLKPNFKVLGKQLGAGIKELQQKLALMGREEINTIFSSNGLHLTLKSGDITLKQEHVLLERKVKEGMVASTHAGITIVLDMQLTPQLISEGLAREIINKINTQRRQHDFDVTDRVKISIDTTDTVKACLAAHYDFIMGEVLGIDLVYESNTGMEWNLNGEKAQITLIPKPR
ncbi:isoleucine--tRNA ligase [Candidatus Aerophobetes bacterium]|uniref:Isoleucine--tRNA ligase n=1 Tax=Aerophobetes bacterium TaxID=2030807 RepID=A0A2A4X0T1_UNCAE|nr:MAG: isoleucine--tRNA ligase [Candidatus Aerophobetes bacterium]